MSTLAEALAAEQAAFRKGPACRVGSLLATLEPADRAALAASLTDRDIPSTFISRALARIDVKVSSENLGRHRKGDCACGKS